MVSEGIRSFADEIVDNAVKEAESAQGPSEASRHVDKA